MHKHLIRQNHEGLISFALENDVIEDSDPESFTGRKQYNYEKPVNRTASRLLGSVNRSISSTVSASFSY